MGFLSGLLGAAVKTVLTPVKIVKDVANSVTVEPIEETKEHAEDIVDDLDKATDDLVEGDFF